MGPFPCPCCNRIIAPFQEGGGKKMALSESINFLGTLPFDPKVVQACDTGVPIIGHDPRSAFSVALAKCVDTLLASL